MCVLLWFFVCFGLVFFIYEEMGDSIVVNHPFCFYWRQIDLYIGPLWNISVAGTAER